MFSNSYKIIHIAWLCFLRKYRSGIWKRRFLYHFKRKSREIKDIVAHIF